MRIILTCELEYFSSIFFVVINHVIISLNNIQSAELNLIFYQNIQF